MIDSIRRRYWKWYRRWKPSPPTEDPTAVFSKVYSQKLWGGEDGFFSGSGSHTDSIVRPYLQAVGDYLDRLGTDVHLVDIGCGDFNVGQHLVEHTTSYVACDVVPSLIERNRATFTALAVRFELVNAVDDPLPVGNVVCIRQVLQHLNNRQIGKIVDKLAAFPHWIITEHLPAGDFVANHEHATGSRIRVHNGSGVVLTRPPFNVRPAAETVLCEVDAPLGGMPAMIRTVAYRFT